MKLKSIKPKNTKLNEIGLNFGALLFNAAKFCLLS